MNDPWLTDDEFRARTIMAPEDVERLQGVAQTRGVADTLATDATAETPLASVEYTGNVVGVRFFPDVALIANGSNYATLTVYKRSQDGTQTEIATVNTSAVGWTPGVPVQLAIVAAPVANGDTLTYAIAKTGTGVIVPTGRFVAKLSVNFITTRIVTRQAHFEARLRKRYAIPFADPVPEVALKWLTDVLTKDCFDRRGRNPTSAEDQAAIDGPHDAALAEIKEAADAVNGLFELPLRDDQPNVNGVSKAGPLSYSETSPYVSMDLQACKGREEDFNRTGSNS